MFLAVIGTLDDNERDCAERIYHKYGKMIYSIAFGVVKNHHDAEDVLDKVMINIMENIERFLDPERNNIAALIVLYSRNEAINVYNKKKKRLINEIQTDVDDEDGEFDISAGCVGVEDTVVDAETAEIVRENIARLPDEYADVLRLIYQCGYSYAEAAGVLHISESAVTMRLYRAKKKLLKLAGGELSERLQK